MSKANKDEAAHSLSVKSTVSAKKRDGKKREKDEDDDDAYANLSVATVRHPVSNVSSTPAMEGCVIKRWHYKAFCGGAFGLFAVFGLIAAIALHFVIKRMEQIDEMLGELEISYDYCLKEK